MKTLSKHAEWLSLIEISGPFLTVSILEQAFPQGLDALDTHRRQKLRAAYDEWREAVDEGDELLPELHNEWIRLVLTEMLDYDSESLIPASKWPDPPPTVSSPEHSGSFAPDWIVRALGDDKPRLFVSVVPPDTDLESLQRGDTWPVSLQERMTLLCRAHGTRIGLLSNGECWMLVNAPIGSTSGHASWYARLWFQEPVTLQAFQSLLGVRRCFGPMEERLETLLEESLKHHEAVTDTLGEQVRRAVKVLVQCLDKADEDRNRELLRGVSPAELYEAGLTVMMRLVFVLCAEERGLLLSGEPVYDQYYAVSTLRSQLAEEVDRHGPEVLDRRHDAWVRLLAVFRAVHGGVEHENLRVPAMGGSLFDPDRFPFLEGRATATRWRDTAATPLPIDNRTVLLLLNSLQLLEQSGGALLLSYRALDIEQIGHVYEGLLEHTVARVPRVTLGLVGSQKARNPNLSLAELESARIDSEAALTKLVAETTGRNESAIRNGLAKPVDEVLFDRLLGVCGGDTELGSRIRPFANLLRLDAWEDPIVYRGNSFMVTLGADRRETGTHYTPKWLTESIVTTTLEPVVYIGPAEGKPREEWILRESKELLELKVCDPAMGSGAFLVQACRYLGEKLVEAWAREEAAGKSITVDGESSDDLSACEPMPVSLDERLVVARRLVAERCLYGVDVNPLAVELAKLSLWLVTLAKGRPFGFLDHNLRQGDSLLGIHRLEQLTRLSMNPEADQHQLRIFDQNIETAVNKALKLRKQLRSIPIRDLRDVEAMVRLDQEAKKILEAIELIADAMIGEVLRLGMNKRDLASALNSLSVHAGDFLNGNARSGDQLANQAREHLGSDLPEGKPMRKPFHWALEFPEVFQEGGFDALVGNPPYLGASKLTSTFGDKYRDFLVTFIAHGVKGLADLGAYFVLRAEALMKCTACVGLVVTSAIAEGDARTVGLQQLTDRGWNIIKATSPARWRGRARVTYSSIWLCPYKWNGAFILNDKIVPGITPMLKALQGVSGPPQRLKANLSKSFNGVKVYGNGFVITPEEAYGLMVKDARNKTVLYPYITTKDVNGHPTHKPAAWAIRFFDWLLNRESSLPGYSGPVAADFPDCLEIVETRVKPERTRRDENGRFVLRSPMPQLWWIYGEKRLGLYSAISDLKHVLAVGTQATKYVAFAILHKEMVFSHSLAIIADDSFETFAVLNSSLHEVWARQYGSYNLALLRYAPTDLFETFPFPAHSTQVEQIGHSYQEYRQSVMLIRQEGLTDTYNRFHDPDEHSVEIKRLRALHVEMDNAVANAYGWQDVDLGHSFLETDQGVRFTLSKNARTTVLDRLLTLNHRRYEEEVNQGVHHKKSATKALGSG